MKHKKLIKTDLLYYLILFKKLPWKCSGSKSNSTALRNLRKTQSGGTEIHHFNIPFYETQETYYNRYGLLYKTLYETTYKNV